MSTLLEISNTILRAVGERPILSLSSPTGSRVTDAIAQAVRDIEVLHTWEFLHKKLPASSWLLNVATIGDVSRVLGVSVGDTSRGFKELCATSEQTLDSSPLTNYVGTTDNADLFAIVGYGKIAFNPYPNDVESRGRILFYVQDTIKVPTTDTGTFTNLPLRYEELLTKKGAQLFSARFLGNINMSAYFQNEFETLVQQYRNLERKTPSRNLNMYRGNK